MSQVKKYQTGGGVKPVEAKKLKFKINGQDYDLDEQSLQDMINPTFDKMKEAGVVKENNREDFIKTYGQYVNQAKNGTYSIKSSDGKYLSGDYEGGVDANLGIDENGNTAHKSLLGNIVSPFHRDDHQRMAMLNTYLGDSIVNKYTADQTAAKAKTTEEADKAKTLADSNRKDFIGKFNSYKTPFSAIYGKDGEGEAGIKWGSDQYWNLKSDKKNNPRVGLLNTAVDSLGKYAFDKQFDDAETQKAFKEASGYDINDIRKGLTTNGYDNGFHKPLDINGIVKTLESVDLHRSWQDALTRPGSTTTPVAGSTAATTAPVTLKTDGKNYVAKDGTLFTDKEGKTPFSGDKSGNFYQKGKLYSGLYNEDPSDPSSYEDGTNHTSGAYWNGKKTNIQDYWKQLEKSGNQDLISNSQAINNKISQGHADLFKGFEEVNKQYDDARSNSLYAFEDLRNTKDEVKQAKNISNMFPKIWESNHELYAFKARGNTKFGQDGVVRYRYVTPEGKKFTGILHNNIDGTVILKTKNGDINLGRKSAVFNEDGKTLKQREEPFLRSGDSSSPQVRTSTKAAIAAARANYNGGEFKLGGILKAQFGGIFKDEVKQNLKYKSAGIRNQVLGGGSGSMSTVDKVQLGSIAADLASLGLSFGSNPVTAVGSLALGAGATAANFYTDVKKDGFQWTDAGSALVSLGLDAASVIPGAGIAAKTTKLAKTIRGMKGLGVAFAAAGAYSAGKSLTKLATDEKMDLDDWTNIASGIHGLMAGKRMLDGRIASTKGTAVETNKIKINGVDKEIEASAASAIRNAPPSKKLEVAKEKLASLLGTGDEAKTLDEVDFTQRTPGIFNKLKDKLPFVNAKTETFKVPVITGEVAPGGRVLKDYNSSNWFEQQSIKNIVAQQPTIAGAEKFTIGKNGPNATTGKAGLGWMGISKKLQYDPSNMNRSTPSTGYPDGASTSILRGPNSSMSEKPKLALPPASGREWIRPVNPDANVRIREKPPTGSIQTPYTPDPDAGAVREVNNKAIRETVQDRAAKVEAPTAKQVKTPKVKGPRVKKRPAKRIAKAQQGMRLLGGLNNLMKDDQFNDSLNMVNGVYKTPITYDVPKLIQQARDFVGSKDMSRIGSSLIPATAPTGDRSLGAFRGNSGIHLPKLPNLKGVDANTLSEFGRALFTRHLNSQIDTRVEAPLLQAPTEVSPSIKGNLLLKNSFDAQANDLMSSVNRNPTADAGINVAMNLQANKQASQLRTQGDVANTDALNRSIEQSNAAASQNAQVRANVANQNTQTLARSTQANRAAENEKFARMNQPLMDFWKDQNYKSQVKDQQNKAIDTQIALQGKQTEFSNAVKPLTTRQNLIQMQMSNLQNKQTAGQALTEEELATLNKLNSEDAELTSTLNDYTNRGTTLGLLTRKNINYVTPSDYWKMTPKKKDGGKVTANDKAKIEQSKQEATTERQISKQHGEMIGDMLDDETKKEMNAANKIQELIKLALS